MKEGEHHMKQIMIMSHSIFAEGIKSACEDMLGPQNDIITIGFTNNAEFEKTISDKLDKIPEEDELILLFDSMRGTPCTAVIELLRKKNISKALDNQIIAHKRKSVTDWNQSASS